MSDYLPRDVLIDILSRLPIKTLVKCTSVCKPWRSLITNPSFIATHFNRSAAANPSDLILVRSYSEDDNEEHYSLHLDNETFDQYLKPEFPLKSIKNEYFRIVGSCRGLLCLSNDLFTYMNDLYLWNPSIRKIVALPQIRVTFKSHGPYSHAIGFGFDPLSNDYKVVRIVYLDGVQIPPEIDVFTLSTGTWRDISHVDLAYGIEERAPQAYLNGVLHWIASDRSQWGSIRFLIVSFHLGDEVFGEVNLPDSLADRHWPPAMRVAVFRESLSVIQWSSFYDHDEKSCSLWVMKEYGVVESWSKLFSIDLRNGIKSIAGFRKNGEVLVAMEAGYLVSWDYQNKKFKDLHIHGTTKSWYGNSFYVDAYVESLVSLGVKSCDGALPGEGSGANTTKKREGKAKAVT